MLESGIALQEAMQEYGRRLNESEGLHKYEFYFGDGNAAASRGDEGEKLRHLTGMLADDSEAAAAISALEYLPARFNNEQLLNETDVDAFMSTSIRDAIADLDISGGDPVVYKVTRDGQNIFYDGDMEEYLLDRTGGEVWNESIKRKPAKRKIK